MAGYRLLAAGLCAASLTFQSVAAVRISRPIEHVGVSTVNERGAFATGTVAWNIDRDAAGDEISAEIPVKKRAMAGKPSINTLPVSGTRSNNKPLSSKTSKHSKGDPKKNKDSIPGVIIDVTLPPKDKNKDKAKTRVAAHAAKGSSSVPVPIPSLTTTTIPCGQTGYTSSPVIVVGVTSSRCEVKTVTGTDGKVSVQSGDPKGTGAGGSGDPAENTGGGAQDLKSTKGSGDPKNNTSGGTGAPNTKSSSNPKNTSRGGSSTATTGGSSTSTTSDAQSSKSTKSFDSPDNKNAEGGVDQTTSSGTALNTKGGSDPNNTKSGGDPKNSKGSGGPANTKGSSAESTTHVTSSSTVTHAGSVSTSLKTTSTDGKTLTLVSTSHVSPTTSVSKSVSTSTIKSSNAGQSGGSGSDSTTHVTSSSTVTHPESISMASHTTTDKNGGTMTLISASHVSPKTSVATTVSTSTIKSTDSRSGSGSSTHTTSSPAVSKLTSVETWSSCQGGSLSHVYTPCTVGGTTTWCTEERSSTITVTDHETITVTPDNTAHVTTKVKTIGCHHTPHTIVHNGKHGKTVNFHSPAQCKTVTRTKHLPCSGHPHTRTKKGHWTDHVIKYEPLCSSSLTGAQAITTPATTGTSSHTVTQNKNFAVPTAKVDPDDPADADDGDEADDEIDVDVDVARADSKDEMHIWKRAEIGSTLTGRIAVDDLNPGYSTRIWETESASPSSSVASVVSRKPTEVQSPIITEVVTVVSDYAEPTEIVDAVVTVVETVRADAAGLGIGFPFAGLLHWHWLLSKDAKFFQAAETVKKEEAKPTTARAVDTQATGAKSKGRVIISTIINVVGGKTEKALSTAISRAKAQQSHSKVRVVHASSVSTDTASTTSAAASSVSSTTSASSSSTESASVSSIGSATSTVESSQPTSDGKKTFRIRTNLLYGDKRFDNLTIQNPTGPDSISTPLLSPNTTSSARFYHDYSTSSLSLCCTLNKTNLGLVLIRDRDQDAYGSTLLSKEVGTARVGFEKTKPSVLNDMQDGTVPSDDPIVWRNDRFGSWLVCQRPVSGVFELRWWDVITNRGVDEKQCAKVELLGEEFGSESHAEC